MEKYLFYFLLSDSFAKKKKKYPERRIWHV